MSEEMRIGRGRPKKEDNRVTRISIRLNKEEKEMLNFICYKTGKRKSDVLKEGLKMKYNLTKYQ